MGIGQYHPLPSAGTFLFSLLNSSTAPNSFVLATVLAALLGFAALKKRWLTGGGVAMMFLQTYLIICFGSLKMILPMLLFFLFSSVMSKIVDRLRKKEGIEKKGSERDGWQVFANGSFPALLALLYHFFPETPLLAAFGVSICAAISDTWSTEIGALSKEDPLSVITLKRVQKGTSGGVSLLGTAGGFAGSLLVALIFTALFPDSLSFGTGAVIFLCGASGTLIDSLMGARIQLKLRCEKCGKITEQEYHCGSETSYHSGVKWINNDVVNWLSIGATVVISIIVLK